MVADRLRKAGYDIHHQVGCSGYRIDLGILDPAKPGRYILGVECDGATYHRAATARDRDKLRQYILEGLGWTLYRIWSTDWWHDSEKEMQKINFVYWRTRPAMTVSGWWELLGVFHFTTLEIFFNAGSVTPHQRIAMCISSWRA
jgi:very-short-patch-repair endonuclease